MHIIAVASQKGGSGKTTLAGHLAVAADRAGAGPVVLIDTDPQGSLTAWWNERDSTTSPMFANASAQRLAAGIERIRELGVGLLIIDTPPAIADTIVEVVSLADLVIIPARPSPHDLRAAGATVELVESLKKPLIFVVNGATPRARITAEAVMALSQHGTLAPVIVHHRTSFASSMIDGRTVMEIAGDERSAQEITQLWEYIGQRLAKNYQTLLPPALLSPAQEAPKLDDEDSACAA
jgi:chromosome partitioning protein